MIKGPILKKLKMEWEGITTEWTPMKYLKCFSEEQVVQGGQECSLEIWVVEEIEVEILHSTSNE